jgi:L-lactate dehydrogenase complex protein LldE
MEVSLFIPCLVDQFYPQVGISLVKILRKLGIKVAYPMEQTCCGQPAFNTGYHEETLVLAQRFLRVFDSGTDYIVCPSGSCTSMVKVFYPELVQDRSLRDVLEHVTTRIFEFSDFLVSVLGVVDLGVRFPYRVTYHDVCHLLRELKVKEPPRILIRHVRDIEFIELENSESCCGFGGTFSVKFPEISTAMGRDKVGSIVKTGAEFVVANDSSCLMHIGGCLGRMGLPIKTIHLAELLARDL